MRLWTSSSSRTAICLTLSLLSSITSAKRIFESTSLELCQEDSSLTVSLFDIRFTPEDRTLTLDILGDSTTSGNVTFQVTAAAYGYQFLNRTLNPCELDVPSFCPLSEFEISFNTTFFNVSTSIAGSIPSVAYGIPDLDAVVTVRMYKKESPKSLACVRSRLRNGKTVDQNGVKWATAIIVIFGLIGSGIAAGLGHDNTGSHIALYAQSLFHYFQSIAMICLCAVPLPPIVQSWTQNFVWSVGIIKVHFLQKLATWYQVATGGKPTTIIATLNTKSVQVLKRSIKRGMNLMRRDTAPAGQYVVRGIRRAAFRAGMEYTNVFLTGIIFFTIFVMFTLIGVYLFKIGVGVAIRAGWMKENRFQTFRQYWRLTVKGILLRILFMGYPALMILCFWEFTERDSAAEVILAIIFLVGVPASLGLAIWHILKIARSSNENYKTPAYTLYSNATALNKYGPLYTPFRATAVTFLVPIMVYILVKAAFIGFGQGSGTFQAVALVVIEAVALIGASTIRPWMDKAANGINIAICAVNFFNAVLLLIYTDIFNGPGLLIGATGVIFFVVNALFALALLIIVLVAATLSFLRKNPETRYQPITDNRASFINSQTMLTTELDTLGMIARGESKGPYRDSLVPPPLSKPHLLHHDRGLSTDYASDTSYHGAPTQPSPISTPTRSKFSPGLESHEDAYRPRLPYNGSRSHSPISMVSSEREKRM